MSDQVLEYPIGGLKLRLKILDPKSRMRPALTNLIVEAVALSNQRRWTPPGVFHGEESGIRVEWTSRTNHVVLEADDNGGFWLFRLDLAKRFDEDFLTSDATEALKKLEEYMS